MEQNFFTLGALPTRMEKLGDNIKQLYHTLSRTAVNDELVEHKVEGIYTQFGADEYDQIVVTFINNLGAESDKFVVRERKLATVVEKINKVYSDLIKKGFKTMCNKDKKTAAKSVEVINEVSNVTTMASVNHSGSADANVLVEFILQRHAHSGNLYELSDFVDVLRLCQTKSCGAVNNVVLNGDNIAIEGANGVCISLDVAGMNQSELHEQVVWALQAVIERNKQLGERKPADAEHKEPAAGDKVEAKGELKNATTIKPLRGKVDKKVVERFNEFVCKGVDPLEPILRGLKPSASGQKIRCFIKKAADDAHLELPDTSGVTLVKYLNEYSTELLLTLCATANCKVPPFLHIKTPTVASSSKNAMRA